MRKGERGMGNCGMGNADCGIFGGGSGGNCGIRVSDCGIFRRGIAEFEFRISPRLQQRESPGTASKNSAIRNPNSAFPLEVITENIFQDETSI